MLWSLIASLSAGNGVLADVDALCADAAGCWLLELGRAPSSRRLGEYLSRFGAAEVDALLGLVRALTRRLARLWSSMRCGVAVTCRCLSTAARSK